MASVKVAVRVRPFNKREKDRKAKLIIQMKGKTTRITAPDTGKENSYTFDYSFWTHDHGEADGGEFADQEQVYNDLGVEMLNHAFSGYNVCIFAYGQTGSGKSYSMMGAAGVGNEGIIPRACVELFQRIDPAKKKPHMTYACEVSYLEIYNEKVRDLLNPKSSGNMKVREHPVLGPYVQDLMKVQVHSNEEIELLMTQGNAIRTVAATKMNDESSRSHAVFSIIFTQTETIKTGSTELSSDKVSKISLVDLAGSERAESTGATGARLKEGANINKSLTTLGKVISALAKLSIAEGAGKKSTKASDNFVPYRDSALTWLLRENLGGNSRTAMVAALSPADINYDETLSTLRYADRAKQIVCKAIVNEDPNAKMIRELRGEIERLQAFIAGGGEIGGGPAQKAEPDPDTVAQLAENARLIKELSESKAEQEERSRLANEERDAALKAMGISLESKAKGVEKRKQPHLLNLNEDPMMSELLLYYLHAGVSTLGRASEVSVGEEGHVDIQLSGDQILAHHCLLTVEEDNEVTVTPSEGATTHLNGELLEEPTKISNGARLIFGDHHVFRFVNPFESAATPSTDGSDWAAAQRELVRKQLKSELGVDKEKEAATQARLAEMEQKMAAEKEEADKLLRQQQEAFEAKMAQLAKEQAEKEEADRIQRELDAKAAAEAAAAAAEALAVLAAKDAEAGAAAAALAAIAAAENEAAAAAAAALPVYSRSERHAALNAIRKWKSYRFTSLKTEMLSATPIIKEANAICQELKKNVCFQFILRTGNVYFPNDAPETQLLIELRTRNTNDIIAVWTLQKLRERIFDMREYYHSRQGQGIDPFSDRPPWFRLVGRAFITLKSLLQEAPLEHELTIVNEEAIIVGKIRVSIMPGQVVSNLSADDLPPGMYEERDVDFAGYDPEEDMFAPILGDADATADADEMARQMAASPVESPLGARHGQRYKFVITVLDASDVHTEFVDVFCQFRFLNNSSSAFSTESLQNSEGKLPFYHAQQVCVDVTDRFLEYLNKEVLVFELFGHFESHPLHGQVEGNIAPDANAATPHPAAGAVTTPAGGPSYPKHNLLVWFEFCELDSSGAYSPVDVERERGNSYFKLQQGVQRRVRVTISHESGADLEWERVLDLTIGNVRTDVAGNERAATPALPLAILPGLSIQTTGDDRTLLQVEANWDSSRHDSLFLNRLTPNAELVCMSLSVVVGVKGAKRPCAIKEDVFVRITGREKKGGFFKNLLGPKIADVNRISVVYDMVMKPPSAADTGTGGKKPFDSSNDLGWRPRSISLLKEHSTLLERHEKLFQVEQTKQVLKLVDSLSTVTPPGSPSGETEKDELLLSSPKGQALAKKVVGILIPNPGAAAAAFASGVSPDARATPEVAPEPVVELLVPELGRVDPYKEIKIKGYLLFLESRSNGWVKRWAFVSKNFLYITDHEKDPVIRVVIRLADISIQFSEDQGAMMGVKNMFTICTKHRGFLVQTLKPRDMEVWLNYFDPLLAGTILSRLGLPGTQAK
jgi:kinesin family protein 1